MCMSKDLLAQICVLSFMTVAPAGAEPAGQPITEADVAAWDISIPPEGTGLPAGRGTVAEGAALYETQCAVCHGDTGTEGPADPLVGGIGTLTSEAPVKTVGSFWPHATSTFDYIRRAMPYFAPGSLSDDESYAITAYVLHLNGILAEDDTLDAASLRDVTMPNADGFIAH